MSIITSTPFGKTKAGETVTAFTMKNGNGMTVVVLDYGGTVQSIVVPDRDGRPTDVALGYDDIAGYETGSCWFGAAVGRYANRIGNAAFSLNGHTYHLPKNDGENHLHGVFSHRVFAAGVKDGALALTLVSPDGEEGFPGNMTVTITYTLAEDNALRLGYHAVTDADTHVNLTNHTYFNLSGGGDILSHRLRLNASCFTEGGAGTLPTGNILPTEGTPLDFRTEKPIGADIFTSCPQLVMCRGYDHNLIFDKKPGLFLCGEAWSEETGIAMTLSTTQPAVQLYTGNYVDEDAAPRGKKGVRYPRYGGFCLETQHYPDSPNNTSFPTTLLLPGEAYRHTTEYRFMIR